MLFIYKMLHVYNQKSNIMHKKKFWLLLVFCFHEKNYFDILKDSEGKASNINTFII